MPATISIPPRNVCRCIEQLGVRNLPQYYRARTPSESRDNFGGRRGAWGHGGGDGGKGRRSFDAQERGAVQKEGNERG